MKVALYVRVSTVEQAQEGYSIPAQISLLNDYSRTYNYDVYKIYQDAGISGKNIKDRPSLNELLRDAKDNKFDSVIVWKLSRLSRSLLDLLAIVDTFNKHNISFQSYSEKFDTSTPIGKMLLQLLGSIAEFERNTIAENVKMGLGERFKQGYSKGAIPFGYKHENKQAVIDPELSDIVNHIFETYLNSPDGNCLTELADELNNKGYRTRTGGLWSRVGIRDMLINHFYAGYVRTGIHSHGHHYNNASVLKGSHEPIISEEVFNAVNAKLKSKKLDTIVRFPDNDSILTGLILCPLCGAKMFALNTRNKHNKGNGEVSTYPVRMYRCTNKDKGKGICKGFYISSSKIEPQFMDLLKSSLSSKAIEKAKSITKLDVSNKDSDKIDQELKKANEVKDKYFMLLETGKIKPELLADKINDVLEKIDLLEKQRASILLEPTDIIEPSELLQGINDFTTLFNELSNNDKKAMLRSFIKEIVITKDKKIDYILFKTGMKYYYHS